MMKQFFVHKVMSIKHIKRFFGCLWWLLVVATAALLVCVVGAKLRGEVPQLFGYSVMRIVTGSMEPEIPTGSYILVKDCDPQDVQQGDVICFYSDDIAIYNMPNTHRVVQPPALVDGELTFTTQGDANPVPDTTPVSAQRLIGRYVRRLDRLTDFSNALDGGVMVVIILVVQAGLAIMAVYSVMRQKSEDDCTSA